MLTTCPTHMQGSRQQKATAATVTPVRLADGGVALESNFRQGVKHEVLRSLCQLVNTTKLALEVGCLALCILFHFVILGQGVEMGCCLLANTTNWGLPCSVHAFGKS